jgi:hypothetical protein
MQKNKINLQEENNEDGDIKVLGPEISYKGFYKITPSSKGTVSTVNKEVKNDELDKTKAILRSQKKIVLEKALKELEKQEYEIQLRILIEQEIERRIEENKEKEGFLEEIFNAIGGFFAKFMGWDKEPGLKKEKIQQINRNLIQEAGQQIHNQNIIKEIEGLKEQIEILKKSYEKFDISALYEIDKLRTKSEGKNKNFVISRTPHKSIY